MNSLRHIKDFSSAYVSTLSSFRFLKQNPSCVPYVITPLILNILVGLTAFYIAFFMIPGFELVWPGIEWSLAGIWAFLKGLGVWLGHLLAKGAMMIVSYILGFSVICSFFYGLMVEKVETRLGLEEGELRSISILRQVLDALLVSFFLIAGQIFILIFSIVPVIGTIFGVFLSAIFQSICLGFEFFDFTLSIRGKKLSEKVQYLKDYPGSLLGIGSIAWLFLFIPVLNACLFTLAILGATFIHRRREIEAKMCQYLDSSYTLLSSGSKNLKTLNHWLESMPSEPLFEIEDKYMNQLVYAAQDRQNSRLILFNSHGCHVEFDSTDEGMLKLL